MNRPIQRKSRGLMESSTPSGVSQGRHAAECRICSHPQREEIERDFVNWRSPAAITKHYGLRNRSSVYRRAHAIGLFPKRQRNVRAALEKIIERAVSSEKPKELLAREAIAPLAAQGDLTLCPIRWQQLTEDPQHDCRPAKLGRYGR